GAIPKPTPPPDLSDLQVQVADLAKSAQEIPPLRQTVRDVEGRLLEISQSVRKLGDQFESFRARNDTIRTTSARNALGLPTERAADLDVKPSPDKLASPVELGAGAILFQKRQYREALAAFTKLEKSAPNDARVWYYAALAHGFAANDWSSDGT